MTAYETTRSEFFDNLENGFYEEMAIDVINDAVFHQPTAEQLDAICEALYTASTDAEFKIIDILLKGFIGSDLDRLMDDIATTADAADMDGRGI